MKARCLNPNDPRYRLYGAIGITICKKWQTNFSSFLEDMGYAPQENLELDRINNDGGYKPSNCRWTTRAVQVQNRGHNLVRRGI